MPHLDQKSLPIRNVDVQFGVDHRGSVSGFEVYCWAGVLRVGRDEASEIAIRILEIYALHEGVGGRELERLEALLESL